MERKKTKICPIKGALRDKLKQPAIHTVKAYKAKRRSGAPLSVKIKGQIGENIAEKFPEEVKSLAKKLIPLMPDCKTPKLRLAKAAAMHMVGETQKEVSKKLSVPLQKISEIFSAKYPDREKMDALLETTLLSNAHLANLVFAEKAHTLTARDAAVASGIYSSRFLEVKQARENQGRPQINVHAVIKLSSVLERIDKRHEKPIKAIEV